MSKRPEGMGTEDSLFGESRPFFIPGTEQLDITAHPYRLFIFKPNTTPPAAGFPVMYVLDGNSLFGTMVEAIRLQSRRPEKTGVVPAIIVGIGYQTEAPYHPLRHYDLTLTGPDASIGGKRKDFSNHTYGGASAFFSFLEKIVKPYIEQRFPINQSRQTLFGHSLGGLFVLHTLFEHPEAYQTYIAGSPSIHWNKKLFLEKEHQFTSHIRQMSMNVRLLVGVGELEKHHPCQMNDHAHGLANRLLPLSAYGLHTAYHEFPEEGHTSVLPVLMNDAFRFALYHDDPFTTTDMKERQ
ncbi:alpha/beta hydrolase [Bacillus safensis subsp. safensis]|uniref:alpha/beta hydrolase n=1 Tax=Bacillus TaxID=1386 RepID=UPI0006F921ED|nr:alpha/beta hydrolase-fold protein [Bacillus sp. Root920]KRE20255.1 enterobactin esterase [Bacillus sp. Root920]